ncbi:MAG: M14 family metallopeptidase [Prolixibacteraceae bacterium]
MKALTTNLLRTILIFGFLFLISPRISTAQNPASINPKDFFGFQPGSDRNLFDYEQLIEYFKVLDKSSQRLEMREIGKSPMGKPMYIIFISSAENIKNLDALGEINKKLAIDPDLTADQLNSLTHKGKVFLLATLSMHSSEVGPTQSSPLIAYDLATTRDPEKLKWLDEVVYMMVPNHNPDGMDMIVNHYRKYLGTKYEDSDMPGVYHKYVGHDNNRDFIILSQSDTKAISEITSKTWFPQIMVEKHQMGSSSVRYFVPPNHDPIAENIDEGLWNWNGIFGSNMIKDLTKEGCSGVAQRYAFDNYWPGSTETCLWKNVAAFLTEGASCSIATPVYIEPTELNASGKGLSEYKKSTNMPLPWPGGWWHLSDLIKLELVSTNSIINTCYINKEEILKFRNALCKKEVNKGKTEAPYYYIMPVEQHDKSEWIDLARLLTEHGINVFKLDKRQIFNGKIYEPGAFVIPMAQAFRPFIKEVMEVQEYPVRHYSAAGDLIKPYDIATWSLPLHKGVSCDEIRIRVTELEKSLQPWTPGKESNFKVPDKISTVIFDVNNNAAFKSAFLASSEGLKVQRLNEDQIIDKTLLNKGSFAISTDGSKSATRFNELLKTCSVSPVFVQDTRQLKMTDCNMPKIALVESWFHDMDAGWTRFVFDSYSIPYKVLHPEDFEKVELEKEFDVVVFPGESPDILMKGKYKSEDGNYSPSGYPPEFTKGIGEKGFEKILKFLNNGGKIISWGESTGLFMGPLRIKYSEDNTEEFTLPVRDISKSLAAKGLYCPGSLVNIRLNKEHPLTLGMEETIGVFYRGMPVFATNEPYFDMDRRIIASFPAKDILKSGYLEKGELLDSKSALVWLRKGKGQMILFAFNPQFRSSTPVSYKLLFNALLLPNWKK